jgi:hypothetical protein
MHVDYICLIETLDTTRDIPISFDLRDFSERAKLPDVHRAENSLRLVFLFGWDLGLGLVIIFITYSPEDFLFSK